MASLLTSSLSGDGFAIALKAANAICKFERGVDEHFTWLEEILVEAKKCFVTADIQLLPKTPSAKRSRRARKEIKEEDEENEPPSKKAKSTRAQKKIDMDSSAVSQASADTDVCTPPSTARTTRASRKRNTRNASQTDDAESCEVPKTGQRTRASRQKTIQVRETQTQLSTPPPKFHSPKPIQGFLCMDIKEKTQAFEKIIGSPISRQKSPANTPVNQVTIPTLKTPPTIVSKSMNSCELVNDATPVNSSSPAPPVVTLTTPGQEHSPVIQKGATQPVTPETLKKGATQPVTPETLKKGATQPVTPETLKKSSPCKPAECYDGDRSCDQQQHHPPPADEVEKMEVVHETEEDADNEDDETPDKCKSKRKSKRGSKRSSHARRPVRSSVARKRSSLLSRQLTQKMEQRTHQSTEGMGTVSGDEVPCKKTKVETEEKQEAERPSRTKLRLKKLAPTQSHNTESEETCGQSSPTPSTRSKMRKPKQPPAVVAVSSSDDSSPVRSTRSKMRVAPVIEKELHKASSSSPVEDSSPIRSIRSKMRVSKTTDVPRDQASPVRSTRSKMRQPKPAPPPVDEDETPPMRSTRSKMRAPKPPKDDMFTVSAASVMKAPIKRPQDSSDEGDTPVRCQKLSGESPNTETQPETPTNMEQDSLEVKTPDNSTDEDVVERSPSPKCPSNKVVRPHPKSFLHKSPKPHPHLSHVVTSFIKRNTPTKKSLKEIELERKRKLEEKKLKDAERLNKKEELIRKQLEERKRRNEERMKRVKEQREAQMKEAMDKKRQAEQRLNQMNRQSSRVKEDRLREERQKKEMREKKMAEAEDRRRQEEEQRQQKLLEQEEETRRHNEMIQRKKEFEERERQRKVAEQRRLEEERRAEAEKQQQLEAERLRKIEEEREKEEQRRREEREKELAKEKAEREKAELERRKEKERQEQERLEKERELKLQRLREEAQEQSKRAEEERRARAEQEKMKAMIDKHNSSLNTTNTASKAANKSTLNSTFNKEDNPDSYALTPVKKYKPPSVDNYDITDLQPDDSTDDEEQPRKKIPSWASGSALKCALINQHYHPPNLDTIFPTVDMPDLNIMFTKKKVRFNKRTSSAIWHSPLHKHVV